MHLGTYILVHESGKAEAIRLVETFLSDAVGDYRASGFDYGSVIETLEKKYPDNKYEFHSCPLLEKITELKEVESKIPQENRIALNKLKEVLAVENDYIAYTAKIVSQRLYQSFCPEMPFFNLSFSDWKLPETNVEEWYAVAVDLHF